MKMRIDTHCHLDLFDDPIATARAYEKAQTCCVMATMLPSHYQMALPHLKQFKAIRPALGMHPLRAKESINELNLFAELVNSVEYIGEIGLDFSAEGIKTKKLQIHILGRILPLTDNGKFITMHSRNAHEELFKMLDEYNVGPVCFHYFIGGAKAAERLVSKGHYISLNHQMLSGKHNYLIDVIPRERIIVETDGPFLTKKPIETIDDVYTRLSKAWNMDISEIEYLVWENFNECRTK